MRESSHLDLSIGKGVSSALLMPAVHGSWLSSSSHAPPSRQSLLKVTSAGDAVGCFAEAAQDDTFRVIMGGDERKLHILGRVAPSGP